MKEEQTGMFEANTKVLADLIVKCMKDAVEEKTSILWVSSPVAVAAATERITTSHIAVSLQFAGKWSGELTLALDPSAASTLSKPPFTPGDPLSAWLTVVRLSQGALQTSFASLLGSNIVACEQSSEHEESRVLVRLQLQSSEGASLSFLLAANPSFHEHLTRLDLARCLERNEAGKVRDQQPNLQRVLDVPLSVTLRFGQHHLTLREVLALGTGSLVELDRQVEEPVDLVLGDRLVARGEVVIVDGNYGLRVTEVMEGATHRIQHLQAKVHEELMSGGAAV